MDKSTELRRGVMIFAALAILTTLEYFIGIQESTSAIISLLWVIALLKGGLVLYFFMHVLRVFKSDGGHS